MRKRLRVSLTGLTASLALLVALASVQPVSADLECDELRDCKGGASCEGGGDPNGCILDCNGGATIVCEFA